MTVRNTPLLALTQLELFLAGISGSGFSVFSESQWTSQSRDIIGCQ